MVVDQRREMTKVLDMLPSSGRQRLSRTGHFWTRCVPDVYPARWPRGSNSVDLLPVLDARELVMS
jgi:hypothetical protein